MSYRIEIPLKLPSLNDYINICRKNRYGEDVDYKRYSLEVTNDK